MLGPQNGLTLGQVTRDPRQFTTERNLRGIQGAGEPLMQRYADQNTALIDSLNRQGANEALGEYQTGRQLMDALGREDAASQARVAGMYAQAHAINGNDIPLDANQFVTTAREQLQQQMRDLHLPGAIDRQLERFASGDTPLNVSTAEQFKTILSQGIADNDGKNGNIVRALGIVRDALDNTEPLLGGEPRKVPRRSQHSTARATRPARRHDRVYAGSAGDRERPRGARQFLQPIRAQRHGRRREFPDGDGS